MGDAPARLVSSNCLSNCLSNILSLELSCRTVELTLRVATAYIQQYDPRGSESHSNAVQFWLCLQPNKLRGGVCTLGPWYFNPIDRWAKARQEKMMGSVFLGGAQGAEIPLALAGILVPGDDGSDGADAVAGLFWGGVFAGTDFTGVPEEVTLLVDGTRIQIQFSTNCSAIGSALAILNAGLGNVGSAVENDRGGITISSATIGANSVVEVVYTETGPTVQSQILVTAPGVEISGTEYLGVPPHAEEQSIPGRDATAGTYIGERCPHTGGHVTGRATTMW